MRISDWSSDVCSSDLKSCAICDSAVAPCIGRMFSTLGTPPPEAQADTERPAALIRSALKACAPTIFIWNTPAIFELAARGSNARRDRFANFLRCKGDALARTFYEFLLTIDAAQKTQIGRASCRERVCQYV